MTLAAKAPEERLRRILDAAIDVLRDRGFAGTRVADIAAEAGTSPALVLYHFSSLADVLVEALTMVDDEYYDDLDRASASDLDPRDRLARMGALAVSSGPGGDWELYLEVWVRARHDPRIDEVRQRLDVRFQQTLTETIEDGVRRGCFRCPDATAAALRLSALMDGLAVQVVLDDPGMTARRMMDLWLEGAALELHCDADDLLARAAALAAP